MNSDPPLQWSQVALRIALGITFLSAVADRFGLYGPPGTKGVGWGDWAHFVAYAGQLNWFLPAALVEPIAGLATALEIVFGLALLSGHFLSLVALASAALLIAFGVAMAVALDPTAPLDGSVFTAATAALVLGFLSARQKGASKNESSRSAMSRRRGTTLPSRILSG